MGAQERIKNFLSISEAAATVGDYTGAAIEPVGIDNIGVHVLWSGGSGSPAGTVAIHASIDGTNYTALTLNDTPTITGNSGALLINVNQFPFPYLRPVVTLSSGTMVLTARISGAGV